MRYWGIIIFCFCLFCSGGIAAEEFVYKSKPEIEKTIAEVLKSPEFHQAQPENIVSRIILAIYRIYVRFLAWVNRLQETNQVLFWLFFVGCLVVLGLLIWHIVYTIRQVFFLPAEAEGRERGASGAVNLFEMYREESLNAARQGSYTEAIRYLFLSLVFCFDRRDVISFNPAFTNREYLRLVPRNISSYDGIVRIVTLLDERWYGKTAADSGEYQSCLEFYQKAIDRP